MGWRCPSILGVVGVGLIGGPAGVRVGEVGVAGDGGSGCLGVVGVLSVFGNAVMVGGSGFVVVGEVGGLKIVVVLGMSIACVGRHCGGW